MIRDTLLSCLKILSLSSAYPPSALAPGAAVGDYSDTYRLSGRRDGCDRLI